MGFPCSLADVNRFAARYRAAKCFREVTFDELTEDTVDGYAALVHLLLSYSAFEHFLHCIGSELPRSHSLLSGSDKAAILTRLSSFSGQRELFTAARQHLNPTFQRQIDSHIAARDCNPFYLAGGLRHAFAHGKLAATPLGVPSRSVGVVCRYLCRVLLKVIDREFEKRMLAFEASL